MWRLVGPADLSWVRLDKIEKSILRDFLSIAAFLRARGLRFDSITCIHFVWVSAPEACFSILDKSSSVKFTQCNGTFYALLEMPRH